MFQDMIITCLPVEDPEISRALEDKFGGRVVYKKASKEHYGFILYWRFPKAFYTYNRVGCADVRRHIQDFVSGWLKAHNCADIDPMFQSPSFVWD